VKDLKELYVEEHVILKCILRNGMRNGAIDSSEKT
jgi:hypothetical protein